MKVSVFQKLVVIVSLWCFSSSAGEAIFSHVIFDDYKDSEAKHIVHTPDGGFLLVASAGGDTVLSKVDRFGEIDWQTAVEGQSFRNETFVETPKGYVVATFEGKLLRVSLIEKSSGQELWNRTYALEYEILDFRSVNVSSEMIYLTGNNFEVVRTNNLFEVHPKIGFITPRAEFAFPGAHLVASVFLANGALLSKETVPFPWMTSADVAVDYWFGNFISSRLFQNGRQYVAGRREGRPIISSQDEDGIYLWRRHWDRDGQFQAMWFHGDGLGAWMTDSSSHAIQRYSLNGRLQSQVSFPFEKLNIRKVKPLSEGEFLVIGKDPESEVILELFKNGKVKRKTAVKSPVSSATLQLRDAIPFEGGYAIVGDYFPKPFVIELPFDDLISVSQLFFGVVGVP